MAACPERSTAKKRLLERACSETRRNVSVVAVLLVAFACLPAAAADIPGGGPRSRDCVTIFRTDASPVGGGSNIRCRDGDPACDADGVVNGACAFPVKVCVNSTRDASSCLSPGAEAIAMARSICSIQPG